MAVLAAHPLCAECQRQGRITAAHCVHHIVPVEAGRTKEEKMRLCYSVANLMPLCRHCHKEIHASLGKGTKEENERRAKADAAAYCKKFFNLDKINYE